MYDIDKRTVNYTAKNIREFTPADTIYIKIMKSGFDYHYLCHFVKLERGIVYGRVISVDRDYGGTHLPTEVKARLKSCYLWGRNPEDKQGWDHCNWFNLKGFAG